MKHPPRLSITKLPKELRCFTVFREMPNVAVYVPQKFLRLLAIAEVRIGDTGKKIRSKPLRRRLRLLIANLEEAGPVFCVMTCHHGLERYDLLARYGLEPIALSNVLRSVEVIGNVWQIRIRWWIDNDAVVVAEDVGAVAPSALLLDAHRGR